MLLMIDNYDSFTFNLVQYFGELGEDVVVKRNDEISLSDIEKLSPARIVISPGPCSPTEAGISVPAVENYPRHIVSRATTRWSSSAKPVQIVWKSRPGRMTARSWGYGTRHLPSKACSFIPNRS